MRPGKIQIGAGLRTLAVAVGLCLAACESNRDCVLDLDPTDGTVDEQLTLEACVTCGKDPEPLEGETVTFSGCEEKPCTLDPPENQTGNDGCAFTVLGNDNTTTEPVEVIVEASSGEGGTQMGSYSLAPEPTPTPIPVP